MRKPSMGIGLFIPPDSKRLFAAFHAQKIILQSVLSFFPTSVSHQINSQKTGKHAIVITHILKPHKLRSGWNMKHLKSVA